MNLVTQFSPDMPYDFMTGPSFSEEHGTNLYSFRIPVLALQITGPNKESLKSILNQLIEQRKNTHGQLNDDDYAYILEDLHAHLDSACKKAKKALDEAGFQAISKWSVYSNSRATAKIEALLRWLSNMVKPTVADLERVLNSPNSHVEQDTLNLYILPLNQKGRNHTGFLI